MFSLSLGLKKSILKYLNWSNPAKPIYFKIKLFNIVTNITVAEYKISLQQFQIIFYWTLYTVKLICQVFIQFYLSARHYQQLSNSRNIETFEFFRSNKLKIIHNILLGRIPGVHTHIFCDGAENFMHRHSSYISVNSFLIQGLHGK